MKKTLIYTILILITPLISKTTSNSYFLDNQQGTIYKNLSKKVKTEGPKITLEMTECPEPTVVQISYLYKIPSSKHQGISQILEFNSKNMKQNIHLLIPQNDHNAKIRIDIMLKTSWNMHIQLVTQETNYTTHETVTQQQAFMHLLHKVLKQPKNTLLREYVDLKNNEIIKIPYASLKTPHVNEEEKQINEQKFGLTYNNLKEHLKNQPYKKVFIKMSSKISENMQINISSFITKPNGNTTQITQTILMTPDTENIEIHIPQPPINKKTSINLWKINYMTHVNFNVKPASIFQYLQNKYLSEKDINQPHQQAQNDINDALEYIISNNHTQNYDTIKDGQTIILNSPEDKIIKIKKILKC